MLHYLLFDLRQGLAERKRNYLLFFLTASFLLLLFFWRLQALADTPPAPGLFDCLAELFCGKSSAEAHPSRLGQIPLVYLAIHTFLIAMVVFLPAEGRSRGAVLIRIRSRSVYLISQYVRCLVTVFLLYLILCGTAFLFWLLGKSGVLGSQRAIATAFFHPLFLDYPPLEFLGRLILIPFFITLALAVFGLTLSVLIGQVKAFVALVSLYLIAGYTKHPALLPSYLFLLEKEPFRAESFLRDEVGCILSLVLMIFSVLFGLLFFSKKDVF